MQLSRDQLQKMDAFYGPGWTYQAPTLANRFDKTGVLELRAVGGVFAIPDNSPLVRVKGGAGVVFVLQRYGCTFTDYRPDPDFGGRVKPVQLPPLGLFPTSWGLSFQPRTDGIASMSLADNGGFSGFVGFEEKDVHKGATPLLALCPEKAFLEIRLYNNGAIRYQPEADQYGVFSARLGGYFLEIPK